MSVRTTSVNSGGETGLIKYLATPALSALAFHSPTAMAVSTVTFHGCGFENGKSF